MNYISLIKEQTKTELFNKFRVFVWKSGTGYHKHDIIIFNN